MVRKCAYVLGILLGVAVLAIDGTASTAEACGGCGGGCGGGWGGGWGGCRTRCCRPRCGTSCNTCYSGCNSCGSYGSYGNYAPSYAPSYAAPSCSSCTTSYAAPVYYGYPTPVNVSQVPGYGAQYNYSAPVVAYPARTTYRTNYRTVR
jgi:hypothetical protein